MWAPLRQHWAFLSRVLGRLNLEVSQRGPGQFLQVPHAGPVCQHGSTWPPGFQIAAILRTLSLLHPPTRHEFTCVPKRLFNGTLSETPVVELLHSPCFPSTT